MRITDLTKHGDIGQLTELFRSVSKVTDPRDVMAHFGQMFWRMRPMDCYISVSVRGLEPGQYKITRHSRVEADDSKPPDSIAKADPWANWDKLTTHTGGFIGDLIDRGVPQVIEEMNLTDDSVLGDKLSDMRVCVASPHFDGGKALNWALSFTKRDLEIDMALFEQMFVMGNLVGAFTRNLVAIERAKELNKRLQQQFEEIARVQQSLLPEKTPSIPGLEIGTSYLTSDEAGGDYYDFFHFPDDTWGILIADVAGHGAPAATVMAMLHAILHAYDSADTSPEAVLAYANERLCHAKLERSFVTAFFAVYDPKTATMRYARAGHNPPRLKSGSSGEIHPIEDAGTIPLGLLEEFKPSSAQLKLNPGDALVLYTDGITEAFDDERKMFDVSGLDAALGCCACDPQCVIDSVHARLYKHTGKRTRVDDQTIVAIQYTGMAHS